VLTSSYGAVPEILEDGVTGFIRETDDELVEAIGRLDEISRQSCREYVRGKFDIQRMAMKYLNVYSKIQQRRPPFTIKSESEVAEEAAATTPFVVTANTSASSLLQEKPHSFAETPAAIADDADKDERALRS